jgi:HPt (histidine-containing phosphotransfer) domain-containing protein
MKFDLTLLHSMSGGDENFVKEMVQVFVRQYEEAERAMKSACSEGDWMEVGRLAHKLKASIDTMSIGSLKQLIRDIEMGGKEGKDLGPQCGRLFGEMDVVIMEMKALLS